MKSSIVTQILAGAVGAVASVLATIAGLIFLVIKVVFQLPTTAIDGATFFAKQFKAKPSNKQINDELLAQPMMQDGTTGFVVIAGSGRNGDEDRKLPFPIGFLTANGLCPGETVSHERAMALSRAFVETEHLRLALLELFKNAAKQRHPAP